MTPEQRIIVALDVPNSEEALKIVRLLYQQGCCFKIGFQFMYVLLAELLHGLAKDRARIQQIFELINGNLFWDGKLNDIPTTVGKASAILRKLEVKMFNVHASAGLAAMKEAVANKSDALALAVTVLTSLEASDCEFIFGELDVAKKVCSFAQSAVAAGMDGIVCSSQQLSALNKYRAFDDLIRVVAGTRSEWAPANDQKRVMTPAQAVNLGADYLVIGRQITSPPKEIGGPAEAFLRTAEEMKGA